LSTQIATALAAKTDIDPAIVARLGEDLPSFVESSTSEISQAAWRATLQLSAYRSFLNSRHGPNTSMAVPTKPPGVDMWVEFDERRLPGTKEAFFGVRYLPNEPIVSGSESAMFVRIGNENKVVRAPRSWVVEGQGVEIRLDGYHVRNSIIQDAHIVYDGGPLILESVSFVNCVFTFKNTPTGQQLATNIVTQLPLNFKNLV
jgi:hypothetical protein